MLEVKLQYVCCHYYKSQQAFIRNVLLIVDYISLYQNAQFARSNRIGIQVDHWVTVLASLTA
jgi:hypothetical protein